MTSGAEERDSAVKAGGTRRENWKIIHRPHYGRWSVDAALVLFVVGLAWISITNPNFQWDVVLKYLFHPAILSGLSVTVRLTVITMVLGVLLGIVFAMLMLSRDRFLSGFAAAYIWLFRGTPLLVQLIFWFNISALYPQISFGIPGGPYLFSFSGNAITPFMAAVLGLSLHEGAYMAEIVRGGVLAVGRGQSLAAVALGMTPLQAFRRITLPQALRIIVPASGNQVILMLKTTSLVSVIALPELLYSAQTIYARTFEVVPLLIVVSLWYLLICSLLSIVQYFLERRLGKGF
ncbi:amino acid ABC transporter permease [Enterovirga sp.]|uniref:amino acid ABC transporter permease n=1 Tax=Enterovirga sp. TaxID=2026350 RepID=UPI002BC5F7CE|nr:amino acid ABC transporter permease [Enterovirga sp.]HMO28911.1 amino acid ABC transporter permease [Enterovirga sp.]